LRINQISLTHVGANCCVS